MDNVIVLSVMSNRQYRFLKTRLFLKLRNTDDGLLSLCSKNVTGTVGAVTHAPTIPIKLLTQTPMLIALVTGLFVFGQLGNLAV